MIKDADQAKRMALATAAGFLAIFFVIYSLAQAAAEWRGPPGPNATWFKAQKDCHNSDCCGVADARPYYDGYTENADGSVLLADQTRLDSCKVLRGPNPTGHPVLWRRGTATYCFAPGGGS